MSGQLVIPKFREKIIHWATTGGTEVSYPVSTSYKGILRLSPNDDATLMEQEPMVAFNEEVENYYRDSIDPAITQQFMRISTSDGYFVGLRLSQYELESDDIYVIGPAKFDMLRLYAEKDNAFKIKQNTALPARVNPDTTVQITADGKIMEDISGVNVHDTLDRSAILISHDLEERNFVYQQTTQLIRELVIESLLDLSTVPTGSIHFTPISIAEYKKMITKGYPNNYFQKENSTTPNDPIIRDYLVCDGSLYRNVDYPELAKVLEGERIDYWYLDSEKGRMVQKTYYNNYGTDNHDENQKVFRVPDLRARFIKSLYLDRDLANAAWNETGMYSNDARPVKSASTVDNHVHYVASAFYQPAPNNSDYATVATEDKKTGKWTLGTKPGVIAPTNAGLEREVASYGDGYATYRYSGRCIKQNVWMNNSGYFLSIPAEYDYQNPNCVANVGLSSVDIVSCVEKPTADTQVSYNKYKDFKQYVGTGAADSYGMENVPEFYCMLPLIKI